MYRLLVLSFLVGVAMAVPLEDQKQQTALENTARQIVTGPVGQALIMAAILTLIVVGILVLFRELFLGISQTASKKYEEEEPVPEYYSYPSQYSSYTSYQSRAAKDSVMTQVLNSIDPVDMSFRFMEIDNSACRKRALCELSAKPLIGQLFRYISPSINSLSEYQDAMSAGEALQDCALLFAECPENQPMK